MERGFSRSGTFSLEFKINREKLPEGKRVNRGEEMGWIWGSSVEVTCLVNGECEMGVVPPDFSREAPIHKSNIF